MEEFTYYLPCIYAFLACIGFSLLFNIHGAAGMLICAGGGALGWLVYLLAAPLVHSDIIQSFFAALAISAWSEIMARSGETSLFLESLLHTLGLAGALAVGVLMVASLARLVTNYQNHRRGLSGGKHP